MARKSKFGWLELIFGVLFIMLGAYSFSHPSGTLAGVVIFYGFAAIISGISDIVLYAKLERRTGFGPVISLVSGILGILAGIFILFNLGAGALVLSILFPIWFIAHCISRLFNIGLTKIMLGRAHFYFSLTINILGILLGVLLLFNPLASSLSISFITGYYLILIGVGSIVLAFRESPSKE